MKIAQKTISLALFIALILSSCATQQARQPEVLESEVVEPEVVEFEAVKAEPTPQHIQIKDSDATIIGEKIWMNEGAKVKKLTVWKKSDTFASLGIGSFNWYPAGIENLDNEFPHLLEFLQQQGVALPEWLQNEPACPWNSPEEFYNNRGSTKMRDLQNLLKDTLRLQVKFLIKRLKQELPKMLEVLPTPAKRQHVHEQFNRVAEKNVGVYALIDYINFQGKGFSLKKPYQENGWGLLQVLENMSSESSRVMVAFAQAANKVLTRRAKKAPRYKRLLPGWRHRIKTYTFEF